VRKYALFLVALSANAQPLADHHQHLFQSSRAATPELAKTAKDLIAQMDQARIRQGAVLSIAYSFSNPNRPPLQNEYDLVKAENDFTREQVAQYPRRLIAFCSVNPLKDYALDEIRRWQQKPGTCKGLKLHFGNSDVDLLNPRHIEQLRSVFRAANQNKLPIVVHIRPSVDRNRPWGATQAQAFLDQVLPEARDITVQLAHLCGAGSYDKSIDSALEVFVNAIAAKDNRTRKLVFDISGVWLNDWGEQKALVAQRVRQIGFKRIYFGSDAAVPAALLEFHTLPLTANEFRMIEKNRAVYWKSISTKSGL